MNRRDVLKAGAATLLGAALPGRALALDVPVGWRVFEVTMTVTVAKPQGETRLWLPLPSSIDDAWVQAEEPRLTSTGTATVETLGTEKTRLIAAVIPAATERHEVGVVTRVATRDRQVDLASPGSATPLDPAERARAIRATELIPTDGIVLETARSIVAGVDGDLARARAIYEWVVENTFRDPKTRGCGSGDVAGMLRCGNLGGKCADINALYVGLARAAGLPARDVYGIRVAPSRRGYKSLGANSDIISKSQHCRAEVWLAGFGWVPVDPADVRKVALEEPPGNQPLTAEPVKRARDILFGGWEMNWVPYNTAHDLALPGDTGPSLPFLMYPTGVTGRTMLDSLDPDAFGYRITSREIVV